jgi:hypothetical protein
MKILEDEEQSLDDLVVRARNDAELKRIMEGKPNVVPMKGGLFFTRQNISGFDEIKLLKEGKFSTVHSAIDEKIDSITSWNNHLYYVSEGKLYDMYKEEQKSTSRAGVRIDLTHSDEKFWFLVGKFDAAYGIKQYTLEEGQLIYYGFRKMDSEVSCMCSGTDTDGNHSIYCAFKDGGLVELSNFDKWIYRGRVTAMCVAPHSLVFAIGRKIYDVDGQFYTSRDSTVKSLCFHNGHLLDAGDYGLYQTESNKLISRGKIQNLVNE